LAKLFLILLLSVVAILLISKLLTKVRKQEKYNISIATVIVLFAIGVYTGFQDKINQQNYNIVIAFNQGKTIICNSKEINDRDYNYVSGTSVFVAKESSVHKGDLIRVSDCQDIKDK
jgi:hypothetical protein